MLSRTRNIYKLASASRCVVWMRSYHTFPDPNEVAVVSRNVSSTAKTIDKNSPSYKLADSFSINKVFPGVPVSNGIGKTSPPPTLVTKLTNGLSVATQEMPGLMSSFALIVRSGSSYEKQKEGSDDETGLTHMLELNAFGSSKNRTHAEFLTEMELMGGMVQCITNRENLLYCVDVLRHNTEKAMALLADTILHPAFPEEEIQMAKETAEFAYQEQDANIVSRDLVQIAAYGNQPLGNHHFCPLDRLQHITADKLRAFQKREVYGGNCVLAAAGVDHKEFVGMVERQFSNLRAGERTLVDTVRGPTVFVGGLQTQQRELKEPFTKVSMAFEVGGWRDPDLVPVCVLQQLLGGGSSFSAGGPGKGMYSRLYADVLNGNYWVESVEAFMTVNEDCGLLGIDGACPPEFVTNMIKMIVEQLTAIAYHPVTEEQLSRAKNMLKSMMMMQLESRLVVCEDIGRQFVTYGQRSSPAELCKKIDEVTAQDLMKVGRKMLQCQPAVACVGADITQCPPYDIIRSFVNRYRAEYAKKYGGSV